MKYTIDASVMARWFIPGEEYEEEALKIRNDYAQGKIQLYAPTPIKYEVLNSIWKAVTRKLMETNQAKTYCQIIPKIMPTTIKLESQDLEETIEIAVKEKITIYDATYITTAKKTKSTLITADNKLNEKSKNHIKTIHLKEYESP